MCHVFPDYPITCAHCAGELAAAALIAAGNAGHAIMIGWAKTENVQAGAHTAIAAMFRSIGVYL
jgi:hypothetical protein